MFLNVSALHLEPCTPSALADAFSKFLCSTDFAVGLGLVKASDHALETSLWATEIFSS